MNTRTNRLARMAGAWVAGAIALASPAIAQPTLLNGGLEIGGFATVFEDWINFGSNVSIVADPNYQPAFEGAQCAKMFGNFVGPGQNDTGIYQDLTPVTAGTTYTASCRALQRTDDPIGGINFAAVNIEWHDANGGLISFESSRAADPFTPKDDWRLIEVTGIAPANATSARVALLFLQFDDAPGAVFFDDVKFNESVAPCPADLTGSSDPNSPAYGVPDGVVDANDFFFYLTLFQLGCG